MKLDMGAPSRPIWRTAFLQCVGMLSVQGTARQAAATTYAVGLCVEVGVSSENSQPSHVLGRQIATLGKIYKGVPRVVPLLSRAT